MVQISCDGSILTTETGNCYNSEAFCFPGELGLKYLPAYLRLVRIYVGVAAVFFNFKEKLKVQISIKKKKKKVSRFLKVGSSFN